MSNQLGIEDIAVDLSIAHEMDGDFAYELAEDATHIKAEQYGDEGKIVATYRIDVTITKENN